MRKERVKHREMRRIIYALERKWGLPASLYRVVPSVHNYETGKSTNTKTKYNIPRFVSWLANESHKFDYDITFIKANSNFAYGNIFQVGDRMCIFRSDLDLNIDTDKIYYKGQWYDIVKFEKLDGVNGYTGHLRFTQMVNIGQIIEVKIEHRLFISQDISGAK